MSAGDMPEYLTEITRLKDKYRKQLEIYVGLEIDYLDETYNASIPYFRELPLDYRISSIHFLPLSTELLEKNMVCIDGAFKDFETAVNLHFEKDIRKLTARYFDSSMKMVEAGGFDIVGHLDKVYMNGCKYTGFDATARWYKAPFLNYLQLIAEKGLMIEINTKAFIGKKQLFPRQEYLSEVYKMNIPVMVNSDCHYPDLVNDGRREAFMLLKEAGFCTTRELIQGKWQDVAITL